MLETVHTHRRQRHVHSMGSGLRRNDPAEVAGIEAVRCGAPRRK